MNLLDECLQLAGWEDGSGIIMTFRQDNKIDYSKLGPEIRKQIRHIEEYCESKAVGLMINVLPSGIIVPIHRDFLPDYEGVKWPKFIRMHLPVQTNDKCWIWEEDTGRQRHQPHMLWDGPISYWRRHQVGNDGDCDRIHLIVDLIDTHSLIETDYSEHL